MDLFKITETHIALEGFAVWIISHWVVGEHLAIRLLQINPSLPLITASMISSSAVSPVAASVYMWIRLRYIPTIMAKRETFLNSIAFIFLAWLVALLQALFLGKEITLAQEILNLPRVYFYLSLFVLIIWVPFFEETLARGYLFEILRRSYGDAIGLVVTSLLFVAFHGIFGQAGFGLFFIFLFSITFTVAYVQGGLLAAILCHMFVNSYLIYINMSL